MTSAMVPCNHIARPDKAHVDPAKFDGGGVFAQGLEGGGAIFGRLEGAWYSGGRVFVTSTDGGNARMGQVWELDIRNQEIRMIYESPGADVLNMPDNLVVSPTEWPSPSRIHPTCRALAASPRWFCCTSSSLISSLHRPPSHRKAGGKPPSSSR